MEANLHIGVKKHKHEYGLFHTEIRYKSTNRACIGLSFFAIFCGFHKQKKLVNNK